MSKCAIFVSMFPGTTADKHPVFSWRCDTCGRSMGGVWEQSCCPQWDEGPDPSVRPLPRILVQMAERAICDLEGDLASREAEIEQYGAEAEKLIRLMEERDMIRAQIEEIRDAING